MQCSAVQCSLRQAPQQGQRGLRQRGTTVHCQKGKKERVACLRVRYASSCTDESAGHCEREGGCGRVRAALRGGRVLTERGARPH
eukprot:633651-Rhodomonas_salina.1